MSLTDIWYFVESYLFLLQPSWSLWWFTIIIIIGEFFLSVLVDSFPAESELQQVSSSLHDSS